MRCSYIHFRDEGNQELKRSLEIEAVLDLIRFIGTDTPHEEVSGNNFFFFSHAFSKDF